MSEEKNLTNFIELRTGKTYVKIPKSNENIDRIIDLLNSFKKEEKKREVNKK